MAKRAEYKDAKIIIREQEEEKEVTEGGKGVTREKRDLDRRQDKP